MKTNEDDAMSTNGSKDDKKNPNDKGVKEIIKEEIIGEGHKKEILKEILKEIETLRKELDDILFSKNFEIDEEIIFMSKKIDELHNMYLELNKEDI